MQVPRGAFLYHRVVLAEESGLSRDSFPERMGAAAGIASVSPAELVIVLTPRAPALRAPRAKKEPVTAPAEEVHEEEEEEQRALGEELLAQYNVEGTPIGSGGFAKVYLATSIETGQKVAIKVVDLTVGPSSLREMVMAEVQIMARAAHEHIIDVQQYGHNHTSMWMEMTYMAGGDLQQHIDRHAPNGHEISEGAARGIFCQLLDAVDYLHNQLEVVHRDLKPENVLLKQACTSPEQTPHCLIGDFGLSTAYDSKQVMKLHCGTPLFFAPELIKGEGYNRAVDSWSLGLILYLLLCGRLPFKGSTSDKLTARICSGTFQFEPCSIWEQRASSSRDLIERLLSLDPLLRYTAKEGLGHPWTQGKDDTEGMALTVFEMLKLGGS
eukprot:TRINITY_DN19336_c0_g1_i4.p1 TRINITY_DN19336_c0_g1~~TRINITY_DN19336_c0_g1_i4.p1  ORF type:complete len:382 (-),score=123.90 TRINITY_DN19336_c0_g1_i4:173-1318(-)